MTIVPVIVRDGTKETTVHIVMDNVRYIEERGADIFVHCAFECDDGAGLVHCVGGTLTFRKPHDDVSALITYLHPDSKA